MKIGEASKQTGISAKMIRYYESIGLLNKAQRHENSYRDFDIKDIHNLHFIKRSRTLGFSIAEIEQLLELWRDTQKPHSEVKAIINEHVYELEAKIKDLQDIVGILKDLSHHCSGHDRPDCPIFNNLSGKNI